ncbi:MAG: DHA2 family efflux MFS transporter permease subunit [Nitrospirae bacterium]|nr:DHA2 family efflux MFS transporter permease subunit [Nitrospirota bacterium]
MPESGSLVGDSPHYRWWALTVVMVGLFLPVLDTTIVNVGLPNMVGSLDTNTDEVRWVITAYAMAFAIVTLASAWTRTIFGVKRLYLISTFVFTFSSFLCGLSPNLNAMIFFRVLQAVGGGLMMPLGFTIITEAFRPEERAKAFGFFGIVIVLAPTIGPILGGYLIDNFNWRDIFFVNIPVGILSFVLTFFFLRKDTPQTVVPFDFPGFVSLGTSLAFLLIGLTEGERWGWTAHFVYECWLVTAISFWIYLFTAFRVKHPIIDLTVFRDWDFSAIMILNILRAISLFGRMFLLPLFVQTFNRFPATDAGMLQLPASLIAGIFMPVMGHVSGIVSDRGKRIILFSGFILLASAQFMFAFLTQITSFYQILIPQLVFGLSLGMVNALLSSLPQNLVERKHIGLASTLQSNMLQIGGAIGVAVLGNILDHRSASIYSEYQSHVTRSAYSVQAATQELSSRLSEGGHLFQFPGRVQAELSGLVHTQASISGYNMTFIWAALFAALGIPVILLMRRFSHNGQDGVQREGVVAE